MPAVGAVYQMTYVMTQDGQQMETVVHYREITGLATPSQIRVSANLFLTVISPLISTDVNFTNLIIKQMTPLAFDETLGAPTPTTHGAVSNAPINSTIAQIFTKRTGTAGKTHRGRMYLGGIATSLSDRASLNTAGAAVALTVANQLIATYGPSGTDLNLQIGVYSRSIGGFNPFTTAGWQAVTRFDVQPIYGNQRRRRIGVGI